MPNVSNIDRYEHWKLFVMLLETRPLIEFALENVHICTLEICQPLLVQSRNVISRFIYVIQSDLQCH